MSLRVRCVHGLLISGLAVWPAVCFANCTPKYPAVLFAPSKNPAAAGSSVLQIVAIGDSVVWGNGLKPPHKSLSIIAGRLADLTQRNVQVISFAHSGARLAETSDTVDSELPGDLNAQTPTVAKQETCAASAYPDAELILLDGCINEVGATNIALPPPFTQKTPEEVKTDSIKYCGTPMRDLLGNVKKDFPKATVAVQSYFRVVSGASSPLKSESTHGQAMNRMYPGAFHGGQPKLRSESTAVRVQSWQANSAVFYHTAQDCFRWAIGMTNGDSAASNDRVCAAPGGDAAVQKGDRFLLAIVPDDPKFAYGASETHLWKLRLKFLFWTWRKDEFYNERRKLCKLNYQDDLVGEDGCEINPIAHPNVLGAGAYADQIVKLVSAAWGISQ